MIAALALIGALGVASACAQPMLRGPTDALLELHRWLWPQPAVPLPRARPADKRDASPPVQPQTQPAPPQPPQPSPQPKTRPRKPVGQQQTRANDGGPDLPWPCWLVRLHAAGKTAAQLEAEGRANNIVLTAKQRRQAQACLNAK